MHYTHTRESIFFPLKKYSENSILRIDHEAIFFFDKSESKTNQKFINSFKVKSCNRTLGSLFHQDIPALFCSLH